MTINEKLIATAEKFIGLQEKRDRKELEEAGLTVNPSTTPWCAAFVNMILTKNGIKGSGSNLARSFLTAKGFTKVDVPIPGDIVVFKRGTQPWQGHVGFVDKVNAHDDSTIGVLGGNQSDSVNRTMYSTDGVLGYRRVIE